MNSAPLSLRVGSREVNITQQDIERFWKYVQPPSENGCRLWSANRAPNGYGAYRVSQKVTIMAHRLAYRMAVGPIPDGMCVCHFCDVRACCNPDHLWLGTHQDNVDDMVRKGRQMKGETHTSKLFPENLSRGDSHWMRKNRETRFGEKNPAAILTSDNVLQIRIMCCQGKHSVSFAASTFGVSIQTVYDILNGRTWKHI